MAEYQTPSMLDVLASSRAGALLQGKVVFQGLLTNPSHSVNNRTFDKPCLSFATSSQ